MFKDASRIPKEKRVITYLLDPSCLACTAFSDRESDPRRPEFGYRFSRLVVSGLENGELEYAGTLYGFQSLLENSMKLDDENVTNIYGWMKGFNRNKNVLYTISDIKGETKTFVGKNLLGQGVQFSRRLLVAGAIDYKIPTIVTESDKMRNLQEKIRELYEEINGRSETRFRILGILEYLQEKNLPQDLNTD